ncbi:hypothetical protein [Streptococcus pyogenes SSI-1]|nr:hypothetical protein [Streptococcus pyogenes SSI-1]
MKSLVSIFRGNNFYRIFGKTMLAKIVFDLPSKLVFFLSRIRIVKNPNGFHQVSPLTAYYLLSIIPLLRIDVLHQLITLSLSISLSIYLS